MNKSENQGKCRASKKFCCFYFLFPLLLYNCSTYPSCEIDKSRSPEPLVSRSTDTSIHQHVSQSPVESWSSSSSEQRSPFECRLLHKLHGAIHRKWSGQSCWDGRSGSRVRYHWMWRCSKLHRTKIQNNQHSANSEIHRSEVMRRLSSLWWSKANKKITHSDIEYFFRLCELIKKEQLYVHIYIYIAKGNPI